MDVDFPIRVCGRSFRRGDVEAIREIIAKEPSWSRAQIARHTCETLKWFTADGRLKAMSCRVALLRLEDRGLVRLPPPQHRHGNGKPYRPQKTIAERSTPIVCSAGKWPRLQLRLVENRKDSLLWNEAIARFHYLGYKPLAGAQMRYLIEGESELLGAIGFGASAWKIAPRDRWIGWSLQQREARLHLIVNNARFLILPWIRSRNLASWVLSRCARQLPIDWQGRYGYQPVLLETFVERDRFRGSCYRAANWIDVGQTQGRGKLDRHNLCQLPVKQILVYPLRRAFREVLCG